MLAILEKANLVTHEAAEKMSKEMGGMIHRSTYIDAKMMVDEVADKIGDFVAEPWIAEIERLERRVAQLEKQLVAKVEVKKATPVAKVKVG